MTKAYLEVDGVPVPAKDCVWVAVAPCGCECGWSLAEYNATEDEAWAGFSYSKARRRRDEKVGFRMVLKRRADARVGGDCPHSPKFGVEPRPELDGHTWAATIGGRVLHLVPLVIEADRQSPFELDAVRSLCGRASDHVWSARWHRVDGMVECARCMAEAKRRAVTA